MLLSKTSFATGALTMSAFALGTLPALLSLSLISSLAKGAFQRHFLRFAGAGVILLGLMNIQYGLVLTGSGMNSVAGAPNALAANNAVSPTGGPQRMSRAAPVWPPMHRIEVWASHKCLERLAPRAGSNQRPSG